MKRIPAARTMDLLLFDIVPRGLARLGYNRTPRGTPRSVVDDYSLAVPFRFDAAASVRSHAVAVVCHLFNDDLASYFLDKLTRANLRADIFISTSSIEKKNSIAKVFAAWGGGSVEIKVVPNRGRDIAPKILAFSEAYDRYDYLLFLHGKKSSHFELGERWREYLVNSLTGSPAVTSSILAIFERCPQVGFVFPQHFSKVRDLAPVMWLGNFLRSRRIAWRMGIDLRADDPVDFPSGSMFWCRPAALRPLLALGITINDFPPERGQRDSTLAHCIERLFLFACEQAGFTWIKVSAEDDGSAPTVSINRPEDIERFVLNHDFRLLASAKTC